MYLYDLQDGNDLPPDLFMESLKSLLWISFNQQYLGSLEVWNINETGSYNDEYELREASCTSDARGGPQVTCDFGHFGIIADRKTQIFLG